MPKRTINGTVSSNNCGVRNKVKINTVTDSISEFVLNFLVPST